MIFEKLSRADDRYREIEQMITLPEVVSNNKEYSKLMKEYKALTPVIEKYREYKDTEKELNCIVDLGGTVEDVFIYHKVYNKVSAPMRS